MVLTGKAFLTLFHTLTTLVSEKLGDVRGILVELLIRSITKTVESEISDYKNTCLMSPILASYS